MSVLLRRQIVVGVGVGANCKMATLDQRNNREFLCDRQLLELIYVYYIVLFMAFGVIFYYCVIAVK